MKLNCSILSFALLIAVPFALSGCKKTGDKTDSKSGSKTDAGDVKKDAHPSEGPHHGDLVELGDEEYHGEVVHDEKTETVTIYILDNMAKNQVPIDAKEVVINLKHEGKPEQYILPAKADKSDPMGKSSRFQLKDKELIHGLEHDDAEPKLSVKIGGKSLTGPIKHNHGDGKHKH